MLITAARLIATILDQLEAALEAQREEGAIIAATHPPPPVDNENVDVTSTGRPARAATSKTSAGQPTTNGTAAKKKAPARSTRDEEWELDCEICGETGVNVVSVEFASDA